MKREGLMDYMDYHVEFQQIDINGDGFEDVPRFCPVHREQLPHVITGGVLVNRSSKQERGVLYMETIKAPTVPYELLDHKEVASFENGERSAIYELTERVRKSDIVQLAGNMLKLLGLPKELDYMAMCAAWLRDTADLNVDAIASSKSEKFPRLTVIAKQHAKQLAELNSKKKVKEKTNKFQVFQKAVNTNTIAYQEIPDLSQPT